MDFLFGLLGGSTLPWILGIGAALLGYKFLSERVKIQAPRGPSKDDLLAKILGPGWTRKKLENEVRRLKKQANFLGAGKLLEEQGRLADAAEAYLEGSETWAAAATFEKMGRAEKAAELFLQAGDFKKGAALFTQAGKPARAAALFLEKGNNLEAARLYAQANQWATAAELYEKSGYPLRAAEAWEKDGKPLKAAEAYEKHFAENVSFSTSFSQSQGTADAKSALLAGRMYEQANQLDRAATIYSRGGYHVSAAEALLKVGQPAKAAELFLRGEAIEKAADAFDQAGDAVQAATLRGEHALKTNQPAEAAAWFVKGHDYLRAAELYESIGMMPEAASAYEAGESWAAAGGVYIRAGLKDRAAAAYERAGEADTAARLYQEVGDGSKAAELFAKAGDTYRSGEAAARAGDREKAIALLQRVPPSDENYRGATELLARLFIETGRPALAMERLRKAIGSEAIGAGNLDFHYWLALAHEAAGAPGEALALYKKIQAEDLQFRDVPRRVARLAGGPSAPSPATVPPLRPAAPASAAAAAPAPRPASAAPASAAPAAGRPQRFVPKDELANGPLGAIFRGEDATDGRSVAMRMLNPELLKAPQVLSAVASDLKSASQLSHPNLVKVIALMEWEGSRCVVTEYVAGRTFAEALASGRRLAFQQVHAVGRVIAQVLSLLHQNGLVHGSIRPSNIMVSSGVIKLADLGLARLARAAGLKPSYDAPEGGPSAADDLFALCAVMYHLLTATHPLSLPQGAGLPLPSTLAPGVPEAMDKLLLRGLHPRPELRLASAEDLQRELREMVKIG
jgi:tetratricopeptide (TPR) repeat protein